MILTEQPSLFDAIPLGASQLRRRVLAVFGGGAEMTADEVAAFLDLDPLSVRPRTSELHTEGLIRETGERRKAKFRSAAVYTLTEQGQATWRALTA